jgi:hypothetical protein
MSRALYIVLGVEVVLGVLWTVLAAMAQGAGGLAVVGLFFFVYALYAAFFLFAAWVYWTQADKRRIAGWIMVLPFVFWFLPTMIRSAAGGVLSSQQLSVGLLVLLLAIIGTCWVAPRRASAFIPTFLLQSKLFNWLIVLAVAGGWLFFAFVVLYVANGDRPSTSGTGEGLAMAIILAALYLIWLGVGSFGASTWAWVSLRGGIETSTRRLNIAQLVVAAPGVLVATVLAFWLAGQGRL